MLFSHLSKYLYEYENKLDKKLTYDNDMIGQKKVEALQNPTKCFANARNAYKYHCKSYIRVKSEQNILC